MADDDTKEVNKEQVKDGGSEGSGVENARTEAFTDASSNQRIEEMNSSKGALPEGFGKLTIDDKGASGSGKQGSQKHEGADTAKQDGQQSTSKQATGDDPSTKDAQSPKQEKGDPFAKDGQPTSEAADPSKKDTQPGKPETGDPSAKDVQPTREGGSPSTRDAQPTGDTATNNDPEKADPKKEPGEPASLDKQSQEQKEDPKKEPGDARYRDFLTERNVKNPEQFIKDMSQLSKDIIAAKPKDRAKVFGDGVDKFVKDNPTAHPETFSRELNQTFKDSESGKNLRASLGEPHIDLKDINAISKDNPGGVVADKFIGTGDPQRDKELKSSIQTAEKMASAAADPSLGAKQLEAALNKHLKDASEKRLAESKEPDKAHELKILAMDIQSALFRKGLEMPNIDGDITPIHLDQDRSGQPFLKMHTDVSGKDLKFRKGGF